MENDNIKEARERFDACQEATSEQRELMLDDLRFSNPADPQQWPDEVRKARETAVGGARPCLTFDQTNQFISQVVNHWRENKAAIKVRPVDSGADLKVAEALQGIIRHIEDVSRADLAYDMALEYGARCGLGWFRIATEVTNDERNEQDIRIKRISDPFSVSLDPDWQEPDGSDAMFGFVESTLTKRSFERQYPDASPTNWRSDGTGWIDEHSIRVVEYFNLTDDKENVLVMDDPINPGQEFELAEADYWAAVKETGVRLPVIRTYTRKTRRCQWKKLTGDAELDSSEFPASHVPLIPVVGSELWIEGKRHLCGMVRPMKDPMRAYNYDRSNYIEHVSLQTKIPYLVAAEAVEGFEGEWGSANRSNAAYLPFNHVDSDSNPLPPPRREQPPAASAAYVQGAMQAQNDIQASIGMYRANLGAPSNETSGKAINARQSQGDTANFHYADGMARSLRHAGKIIVEMIPKVYDTRREMRILADDGGTAMVRMDPEQQQPAVMKGAQLASMNPTIGKYDVSVSAGPAFGTRRQEAVEAMKEIIGGNPQMMAMLGDEFVKMMDIPGADKIAKRLATMLPPQIQQAEAAEKEGSQSPEVMQVQQQAQQQMQEMQAQVQEHVQGLQQELDQAKSKADSKDADMLKQQTAAHQAELAAKELELAWFKAETERMGVLMKDAQASAQLSHDAAAQLDEQIAGHLDRRQQAEQADQQNALAQQSADQQAQVEQEPDPADGAEPVEAKPEPIDELKATMAEHMAGVHQILQHLTRPKQTRIVRDAKGNITGAESV